jgi:CheY-like chemotaxis protein
MLAGMLMPLGFAIREAASGQECLESVREHCPDAVLLDISMDDLDGWQTSRLIRQAGFEQVPIIMVSANVFENRPENLQAAQCQAFVGKPVMESELLDTLGQHLHLDWVVERVSASTPALPARKDPQADQLPDELRAELTRLARLGHIQGLAQALQRNAQSHPEHRSQWVILMALLDAFDLDGVLAHLTRPSPVLSEDPLDEPQP